MKVADFYSVHFLHHMAKNIWTVWVMSLYSQLREILMHIKNNDTLNNIVLPTLVVTVCAHKCFLEFGEEEQHFQDESEAEV